jgi:GAF domain-containing protein
MTPLPHDPASALAEAARTINAVHSLDATLDAIVRAALASVPGFDHVGISIVHKNGKVETMAATGQLVWELDAVQYELGEGPCLRALREEPVVVAEELCHDQRWPRYVPEAVKGGVRAQMAVQLYTEEETLGVLNLYSTVVDAVDPEAPRVAELFATHAAFALGRARRESQLEEALSTRQSIGTAIGVVMGRYQISQERAFQFLVRASSTGNIKLRDIADEVVATANDEYTKQSSAD